MNDDRSKRPGESGPPGGMGGNKAKIDEEYLSLMAELGEGEPPKHEPEQGGSRFKSGPSRLFESKGPMKALMSSSPSVSSAPSSNNSSSSNVTQVLRNPPPPPPTSSGNGMFG